MEGVERGKKRKGMEGEGKGKARGNRREREKGSEIKLKNGWVVKVIKFVATLNTPASPFFLQPDTS